MTTPMSEGSSAGGSSMGGRSSATGSHESSSGSHLSGGADTSVGQLLGAVTEDLSTLMRQELELAKAELRVEAKKAGAAAGMFGAAGFAGYMAVLFISIAVWRFLDNVMDSGLAALIVAVLWGILGAVLFVMGRKTAREINPTPERTVETVKQVPDALKPNNPSPRHPEEIR